MNLRFLGENLLAHSLRCHLHLTSQDIHRFLLSPSLRPSRPGLPPDRPPSGTDRRILICPCHGRQVRWTHHGKSLPTFPFRLGLTMLLTPFIVQASPRISSWVSSKRLLERLDRMRKRAEKEGFPSRREGHVIIVGFGLNGRNLAEVLKESSVPYVVLELNNDTVLQMKKKGEPIFYGDGTSPEILHKLGIDAARLLVVVISDPASTRRIVQIAGRRTPDSISSCRTRYHTEVDDLIELGANEVIPEEFETSIEIFARVLHHFQVPRNLILSRSRRSEAEVMKS